jgi:FKBP-type peptidyl-prolyl cis-trans isomerase FkpA
MKKTSMRIYVLLGSFFLFLLAACSKDDNFDVDAQFDKETAAIQTYLKDNNLPATLDSATGIYYHIEAPGNGVDTVAFKYETVLKAHYKGKFLSNDKVFQETDSIPLEFYYGQVITGWQIGLLKITKGGKIRLYLPSYWAYGRQGRETIPGNASLIFDIELVDIKNPS